MSCVDRSDNEGMSVRDIDGIIIGRSEDIFDKSTKGNFEGISNGFIDKTLDGVIKIVPSELFKA